MKVTSVVCRMAAVVSATLLLSSCSLAPAKKTVSVGNGQATLKVPASWSPVQWPGTSAVELLRTRQTPTGAAHDARIMVFTEKRVSHDEAVDRLRQIAAEAPGATFLLIDGWPALERRQTVVVPPPAIAGKGGGPEEKVVLVTTAVAAGDAVVRAEGSVRVEATAEATEAEGIGRSLVFTARADPDQSEKDLQRLRDAAARPIENPEPVAPPRGVDRRGPTTVKPGAPSPAGVLGMGRGELSVAAATNGTQVVVAGQFGATVFSNDAGLTFTPATVNLPGGAGNGGDPSIALGASGAYYLSILTTPSTNCAVSVHSSAVGNPATFNFLSNAAQCPGSGDPKCLPDRPHIAADPNPSTTGADQLYVVWRHFTPRFNANCPRQNFHHPGPMIACSINSGMTWTPPAPIAAGDDARVTVGGDGSVWVVQRTQGVIVISKFNSCASGLVMQAGFPKNVVSVSDPSCPVAGLDRCTGPMLSSATVAVDRTDPNHVYVAYARSTSPANDDIVVEETTDGFATWPSNRRTVTINSPAIARRFMPWACTLGSSVQVGWYDRRAATSTANDLTGYFRGSASVQSGSLVSGAEVNVSLSSDPQCATGFPCGERDLSDAESCPTPPLDGACFSSLATATTPAMGSGMPCRQRVPFCPAGEKCFGNGGNSGCPKYGDYNGIACAPGHVYSAWASATPPPGLPAPGGIGIFVDASPCGGPGQSCCLSGAACVTGLSCNAGNTCATVECGGIGQPCCGGIGQPCCGGTPCTSGSGCLAGMCAACPAPTRTLVDTTVHAGSNCFGNTQVVILGQATCDPGFTLGACTATLTSLANGSTCTATPLVGGCNCLIRVQTPSDCSKWADCRVIITEVPMGPIPAGCP